MVLLTDPVFARWVDLETFISEIRNKNQDLFRLIEEDPIRKKAVDDLIWDNWQARQEKVPFETINFTLKIIRLNEKAQCYFRDKALMRGVVYAYYNERLDKSFETRAVAEWLGRKLRADPEMLRHATVSFRLIGQLYDLASLHAYHPEFQENPNASLKELGFTTQNLEYHLARLGVLMD